MAELKKFAFYWEKEILQEFVDVLKVTAHWMAIPLFFIFWIADLLYIPDLKWEMLTIRALIVPLCLTTQYAMNRAKTRSRAETIASLYAIGLAGGINAMIFLIPDPTTIYYAGLNLVAIGCLSFLPFSKRTYLLTASGIYLPYYLITLPRASGITELNAIITNSFFIFGSLAICFLIRFFHARVRANEVKARLDLQNEIQNRDQIIRAKTDEAIRLKFLNSQFSPQVVEAIQEGRINLESGGMDTDACVVFVDILGSTERINSLEMESVISVYSRFLDDAIKTFLRYDLTIDKFTGDGLMAFSNAPIPRPDYVKRVVKASIEFKDKIQNNQQFYQQLWEKPFELHIGIATGNVKVGFFGSKKYFHSYTAIGPAASLAARLCGDTEANQILVSDNLLKKIPGEFETKKIGMKTYKGISQAVEVFEITSDYSQQTTVSDQTECDTCGSILIFELNTQGHLGLMCRKCDEFFEQSESIKAA